MLRCRCIAKDGRVAARGKVASLAPFHGIRNLSGMDIPDKDIDELVVLWKEEFGVTLSADQARTRASVVLDLFLKMSERLPSEREGASDNRATRQ